MVQYGAVTQTVPSKRHVRSCQYIHEMRLECCCWDGDWVGKHADSAACFRKRLAPWKSRAIRIAKNEVLQGATEAVKVAQGCRKGTIGSRCLTLLSCKRDRLLTLNWENLPRKAFLETIEWTFVSSIQQPTWLADVFQPLERWQIKVTNWQGGRLSGSEPG